MSSILLDDLSRWLIQYWEFSVSDADRLPGLPPPLVGVQRYWADWWDLLAISEQVEIQGLVDALGQDQTGQEAFLKWLSGWIDRSYERGSYRVVLAQLAQLSLFRSWHGLDLFRSGAYALFLQEPQGHSSIDDVKPLIAIAVQGEKEPGDPYYAINLEIRDGRATVALRDAFDASLSALQGFVFCRTLLCWIVLGRKNPRSPVRKLSKLMWGLCGIGWAVVATPLFLLPSTDLFTYFPDDDVLAPILLVLALIPLIGLLYALVFNVGEGLRAWSQGQAWAHGLRMSRLYLIDGDQKTVRPLNVKGPSFGFMLSLSNLLALYEAEPGRDQSSWLWRQFFAGLRERLACLSATGDITRRGMNRRVARFNDKWEASRAHPNITEMIAPFQKETFLFWGSRVKTAKAPATGEGRAAVADRIKLRHCGHLSSAMLTIGKLVNLTSAAGSAFMLLISLIAYAAAPDVISLADLSPPELLDYQVTIPDPECHPDSRYWLLTFHARRPDELEIYDHSHHRTTLLTRSAKNPEYAIALIEAGDTKLAQNDHVAIELRQHRKLLGVSLPDKTVLLRTLL